MDKVNMQQQAQYDYNAYAALILLLNGWWRMCMTDEQRNAVMRSHDRAQVHVRVDEGHLQRMGFDEDTLQLYDVLHGICREWDGDEAALLPFELRRTEEGKLLLDMVKEDFLTIILLDGFDMHV